MTEEPPEMTEQQGMLCVGFVLTTLLSAIFSTVRYSGYEALAEVPWPVMLAPSGAFILVAVTGAISLAVIRKYNKNWMSLKQARGEVKDARRIVSDIHSYLPLPNKKLHNEQLYGDLESLHDSLQQYCKNTGFTPCDDVQ